MNATVDIDYGCKDHWAPESSDVEAWINSANNAINAINKESETFNVSLKIVSSEDSAALNKQYRDKESATNVLSFCSDLPSTVVANLGFKPLGDIAICAAVVEAEAKQQGKKLEAHWAHLVTHGFLHLNGFEHDNAVNAKKMESLEIAVLDKLGFPNPYLATETSELK
jgi:probable rRNA maturation factor